MILGLYGKDGLVFQSIATGFKEGHIQNKLKFEVVEADKVGAKFKNAVKDKYSAKFLDDADMVVRFAIPKVQEPAQTVEAPPSEGEAPEDNTPADETPDNKDEVSEAESTAQGMDLKKKIIETVSRTLFESDKTKIEMSDLDNYMDGYDVSFIKISLKDGDSES